MHALEKGCLSVICNGQNVYSEMRRHIQTREMHSRVITRLFPLTLKGEAESDMENLFKTRNEGGGAKLTSCFKFPFKAGM